jgi:hypothetical protein
MKFGGKIAAGALPCLLMLAIALTPIGCGGSMTTTSGMSTTNTAASTVLSSPSTNISSKKQAAEAYLTAIAPTIEKDYQGSVWFHTTSQHWAEKYGESSLSTSLTGWTAILPTFEQALTKENDVLQGYLAITPPSVFKTEHAALIENNRASIAAFERLIAAIKAKRPAGQMMALYQANPSPTNAVVLADLRAAAASAGFAVPAELTNAYPMSKRPA